VCSLGGSLENHVSPAIEQALRALRRIMMKRTGKALLSLLTRIVIASMVIQTVAVRPAMAFKPNDAGHLGITSEALKGYAENRKQRDS
jgi:hypothetical protein